MTDDVRAGTASGAAEKLTAAGGGQVRPGRGERGRAHWLPGVVAAAAVAFASAEAGAQDAASATSAADFGGMDQLIAAAQEEGELNVIALPPDWANYGRMIETFAEKYGITVNSAQPDASRARVTSATRLAPRSDAMLYIEPPPDGR